MHNFTFYNPTKIEFGKDKEKHIGKYISEYKIKKILLCYGSERIKKDGLFNKIKNSLNDNNIEFIEFGGIISNPILSTIHEGIKIAKKENVDGVLAIGGGSVLDSAKTIAAGVKYSGDVWDFFTGKATISSSLPIFDIMTIAATGSEMNGFAVVTNDKTKQKYSFSSIHSYPTISVLNPELTKSVSSNYLAYSAADIIAHCIEGYFTAAIQPIFQSQIVESIIRTVIRTTNILIDDPKNYEARAEFMWAATLGLNGITTAGTFEAGFPNHMIEHSISAIKGDIAHGAGLSVVMIAWMKWFYNQNLSQFERFANEVFGAKMAQSGIETLEKWFNKIGTPTKLSQLSINDKTLAEIIKNAVQTAQNFGVDETYNQKTITEIFELAK